MQVCFDNREADIGRFIRRHLGGVAPSIAELITAVRAIPSPDTGAAGFRSNTGFLRRMLAGVPRITKYSPWLDTAAAGPEGQPQVRQGRWEALLVSIYSSWGPILKSLYILFWPRLTRPLEFEPDAGRGHVGLSWQTN